MIKKLWPWHSTLVTLPVMHDKDDKDGALPEIFDYILFRDYLRDYLAAKKNLNPKYSLRLFMRATGAKSSGTINNVLSGRKSLSLKSCRKYAEIIGLDAKRTRYFELMVQFDQTKIPSDRESCLEKMRRIVAQKLNARFLSKEEYAFFRHRHYVIIREMILLASFREEPAWIAKKISPPVHPHHVREAIDALLKLNLIKRDAAGKLQQTDQVIYTPAQVNAIELYHNYIEQLAAIRAALIKPATSGRSFNCITLPLNQKLYEKLKKMISEFLGEVLATINSTPEKFEDVYQLNVFLYPATQTSK